MQENCPCSLGPCLRPVLVLKLWLCVTEQVVSSSALAGGHLHPPAAALGEFVHLGTAEAHLSKHTLELEQQQLRFSSPASCFVGLAEPCMK